MIAMTNDNFTSNIYFQFYINDSNFQELYKAKS